MTNKKKDAATKDEHQFKTHIDNTITKETRQESYVVRPITRANDILRFMGDREMTARQIAYGMGFKEMNAVRPRLTELKEAGKVEVVKKAYDPVTDRNVAVWRAV